jgi:hypothetical protein
MFLRTQCDRELYLSLFKQKEECLKAGIPVPLKKARPGVQLITRSGQEFESEQYDELIRAIPDNVLSNQKGRAPIDPVKALEFVKAPSFILQPQIEPEDYRDFALANLGLTSTEKDCIPQMSGLKPDVLYIHKPLLDSFEILPNGSRCRVTESESRLAISVIDLKNVTEGNPSYAAEVCLYAFFFANWLAWKGGKLREQFFVSDQIYLWKHTEMPEFKRILGLRIGVTPESRIKALLQDLEEGLVDYAIYMPAVRKFFKEDIPRVVQLGDSRGWEAVNYHVNSRCGACDWLGNVNWLSGEDLEYYQKNPQHYCFYSADTSDHLCKMAGLSKGASQILHSNGHSRIVDLVGIAKTADVLKKHAILKRDRSQIAHRALALNTGTHSVENRIKIGGLARDLNAEFDIIVDFEAGSGLLTGVALRGLLLPPYKKEFILKDSTTARFKSLGEEAFVVQKDTEQAEWATLQGFINRLAMWIDQADQEFQVQGWADKKGKTKVKTQICFWEIRQYEELCNAFGRHLLKVLELNVKTQRALAWIFPAEELMERDEYLVPSIVFIRDIVDVSLRLPVKFANTLLDVAEYYHSPSMSPRRIDNYYREPLSNGIPRERIFEIWKSTTGTVRMYGNDASLMDATTKYGDILKAHAWALTSVTARLRKDLKGCLEGTAPALAISDFRGATGVAYDSKLWIQWAKVSAATSETEGKATLIANPERLESSYKAIILTRMLRDLGGRSYEFEVSEESTEAKLEEGGGYYVFGVVDQPEFLLLTPRKLGLSNENDSFYPLHKIIAVTLEIFDRVNRKAIISLRARWDGVQAVFDELFEKNLIPIDRLPIYLIEGLPYNDAETTARILRAVGNPSCDSVAPEALRAMGIKAAKKIPPGTGPVTPIARVLWEADQLVKADIRTKEEAESIVNFADKANGRGLNQSQQDAVRNCARKQLSVVWGPPGTGKTDTLVALLHAIVSEAQVNPRSRKILITGPNYRAVEELAGRLLNNLDNDEKLTADIFWVYSSSREPKIIPETKSHLVAKSLKLSDKEAYLVQESFIDKARITIVATTAHIIHKITEHISDSDQSPVQELFDFVVIDESSQVEVTLAIRPLSVLKTQGQLVVAGDHLQMPPITSLEPPKNAEHLVGSIQTYLLTRFKKIQTQDLLINYRSNKDLVEYAKTLRYPSELAADKETKHLQEIVSLTDVVDRLPTGLPKSQAYQELLLPERAVTALIHEDIVSSQANEVEAKFVAGLAYCLRHSMAKELNIGNASEDLTPFTDDEFFELGLGVVTPHKAQKSLVIRELQAIFTGTDPKQIFDAVDTVERFQGGQRQTIIVSFGVGDTDIIEGEEAFLLQMERTNVAVSRAQAKCIMIMPKTLAYHLPTDQKAAKTAKAIKSYIEEFCNNRLNVEIDSAGVLRSAEVRWH